MSLDNNSINLDNINDSQSNLIAHYRNIALSFINSNKKNLVAIYMQHTNDVDEEYKKAILVIDLSKITPENGNIDVSFVPLQYLDSEIVSRIEERKTENNQNIIYFLLVTPLEKQIIEIDIRSLL